MRSLVHAVAALAAPVLLGLVGVACGSSVPGAGNANEAVETTSAALTGSSVASLALANIGGMACATNSLGGHSFDSSCTGNGGQPEYWCADFARWVWENTGAGNTGELTAAAGSFYVYGQSHGTLSNTPSVGDAVVFNYHGGGSADHVALVTQVNANGTIETASGDWNGQSGTEAQFSATSHVVLNTPAYPWTVGSSPGVMGMTISGYIHPVGEQAPGYGAAYVSQSFPPASTAMTMFAGQTVHASIDLKNTGSRAWDGKTRLATTQPRDRASAFVASDWLGPDRLAGVTGSVAPGATHSFAFDLHAPDKPGTYFEYFNLVEEGVAWFSDSGQGGPPDNDLEAQIVVVPGVRGNLDAAACGAISGWSQDQASAGTAVAVDLYFDAPAGKPGAGSMRVAADVSRPDLCKAIGSCVHGFSVPVPVAMQDGKAHSVYAYGIASSGAGPNELLTGGPKSFTCAAVVPPLSPATGVKRHVADSASFTAWKLDALEIDTTTAADVAAYPTGTVLPATPTVVVATGAPAVWVIDGSVRRHVVDPASLSAWGFTAATWTAAKLDAIAQGPDWPASPFLLQATGDPAVYVLDVDPATPPGSDGGDGGAGAGGSGSGDDAGAAGDPAATGDAASGSGAGCAVASGGGAEGPVGLAFGASAVAAMIGRRRRWAKMAIARASDGFPRG